ncbi:MAG: hypothetical protein QOK29_821 [Rhodospirillaceae bacterium]|nr:hypothetical protein [Rhodospirillaceae bacterium]
MQRNGRLEPLDLIDLDRYPVDALDTEDGQSVVRRFAADLRDKGLCQLEGFLRPEAVEALCAEANSLASGANYSLKECNPYFTRKNPALPADDARNIMTPRCLGMVAGDLIPTDSGLQTLYRWEPIRRFLSAILAQGEVYTLADKYQGLNISVMPEGPGHNWHFDDPDFVVTLMLQKPFNGGSFECVPGIRTPDDENYDGVREVLLGARDKVKVIPFQPGTLMIFRGHYALHRVGPVEGSRPRLVAILSYSTQQGYYGSMLANRLVYGDRVA